VICRYSGEQNFPPIMLTWPQTERPNAPRSNLTFSRGHPDAD
jgi:hypothetical protein